MASTPTSAGESSTNVQVAVRCRPLNDREKTAGRPSVVVCKPNTNEIAIVKRKSYTFDKVYGQYSTQKDVFKATIKPVVDEALAGYNCTVFAYGQTGTGKTHTMQGNLQPDNEMAGIIPRCVRYIFDVLHANHQEYSVKVSFLQLYNEELKDLLAPSESKKLRLMEDVKRGGIYCQNLLEVTTTTASHVFELLETGVKNRITSETLMNENSSRSHSIFTIRIHSKENNPVGGEDLLRIGQLNLVDLAGSECVGRSGARNIRAREAGNINQSLLTLGRVITALVDNHPHVPYRDSKLTRLLQESLGGRAKTTIIATLAPCADSIDETLSTLEYAYRAKNIKNKPEMNQKMTKTGLLKEYGNEIESLRNALAAARAKDGIFLPPAQFTEMQERLAGQAAQITELEDELENRSKLCKELEEQVDSQKQEIASLQRDKIELESTLKQKEEELTTAQAELSKTKQELAETQRVLRLFQDNEASLLRSGGTATKLFRESENRVDLLLEKIERKQQVELANHELASTFADTANNHLKSFEERLHQHEEKQNALFADVESSMDELRSAHSFDIAKLMETLNNLEDVMSQRQKELDKENATEQQSMTAHKAEWDEATAAREQEMEDRLAELLSMSKQNAEHLVNQLASAKETQLTHLIDISANVSKSRDEMSVFLKEQSSKLTQLKSTLDASFEEQAQQLAKHKQALVTALRDGQAQQKSHLEAMKEQLSQMIERSIASHAERIDADVAMVAANVDSHQDHLKRTQSVMEKEIDLTTRGMEDAETLQQTQYVKFEKRIGETRDGIASLHTKLNAVVEEHQSTSEHWCTEAREKEKTQNDLFKRLSSAQLQTANDRIQTRKEAQREFAVVRNQFRSNLMEEAESTKSHLESRSTKLKSKYEDAHAHTTAIVVDSSKATKDHLEQIDSFIKKRRIDGATGATPVKVSPEFPVFHATNVSVSPLPKPVETVEDTENIEPQTDPVEPEQESERHDDLIKTSPFSAAETPEKQAGSPVDPNVRPSTAPASIPAPRQITKPGARKRTLSGGLQRSSSGSSLTAPNKRFRTGPPKKPLSETTNKL